jgi:hypothetical protein
MPSPFPGMDPYLESPALWPGVHQRLITYIADILQPGLRPHYHARIGERLYVVQTFHTLYPDVTVVERPVRETRVLDRPRLTFVVADEPLRFAVEPTELREPFVEIVHTDSGEVITVIEVLSPANKTLGEGQQLYRCKQQEVLHSAASLVEIDLLAEGLHTVGVPLELLAGAEPYRYLVCVNRASNRFEFEVYPVTLARRLPRVALPLREPDDDVVLNLPAIFDQCYDNGGYADFVDYRQLPPVLLTDEEAAWMQTLFEETPNTDANTPE